MIQPRGNGAIGGAVTVYISDADAQDLVVECDVELRMNEAKVSVKRWHIDDGVQPPCWQEAQHCTIADDDPGLVELARIKALEACDHNPQDVIDSAREDAADLRSDR